MHVRSSLAVGMHHVGGVADTDLSGVQVPCTYRYCSPPSITSRTRDERLPYPVRPASPRGPGSQGRPKVPPASTWRPGFAMGACSHSTAQSCHSALSMDLHLDFGSPARLSDQVSTLVKNEVETGKSTTHCLTGKSRRRQKDRW